MERTRPPQSLTADETQQVLKRAAQLEPRAAGTEAPALDFAEVERIGLEAGLSREAIQRAFAELRSGALRQQAPPTLVDKLMGPERVEAQRPLDLPPDEAKRRLHAALKAELLHPAERQGNRTVWTAAPGLWAAIQRGLNWQGQGQWHKGEIVSEVTPAPPGVAAQSLVRLEAKSGERAAHVMGALVPLITMLPMAVVTGIFGEAPPALPFVLGGAGIATTGFTLAMTRHFYQRRLRALRQAIERVLDRLSGDHDPDLD